MKYLWVIILISFTSNESKASCQLSKESSEGVQSKSISPTKRSKSVSKDEDSLEELISSSNSSSSSSSSSLKKDSPQKKAKLSPIKVSPPSLVSAQAASNSKVVTNAGFTSKTYSDQKSSPPKTSITKNKQAETARESTNQSVKVTTTSMFDTVEKIINAENIEGSRKWYNDLDFQYDDTTKSTESTWHKNLTDSEILVNLQKIFKGNTGNPNIAQARISFLYEVHNKEENTKEKKLVEYEMPFFFLSAWSQETFKKEIPAALTMLEELELYKDYKFFHLANIYAETSQTIVNYRKYAEEIKEVLSYNNHTSGINLDRLDDNLMLLNNFLNVKRGPVPSDIFKNFNRNYLHSEQVIFSYIYKKASTIASKLLPSNKEEISPICWILDIASYWEVCRYCGDTFRRENEATKRVIKALNGELAKLDLEVSKKIPLYCRASSVKPRLEKVFPQSTLPDLSLQKNKDKFANYNNKPICGTSHNPEYIAHATFH